MFITDVSKYLYTKATMRGIPLMGVFELSPVCNFHCKMCYVRKTPGQIKQEGKCVRDWTQWLELAKQCKEAGMLFLLLTGGEPFLYPHFKELYLELHKMGFIIYINSNGTLITEETVQWLKKAAPARINLTLYGASADTYEKVCGDSAGFQRACDAIDRLKEAGIALVINASMIPENYQDLEGIIRFGKDRGIQVRVATYMFPPVRREQETEDSRFSPEQSARLYVEKYRLMQDAEGFRNTCSYVLSDAEELEDSGWGKDEDHMVCRAGRSSCWVSWEGQMSACGLMPFPAQYPVFEKPFGECWKSLVEQVRQAQVLAQCQGCKQRHVCRPCAAMLYAETGDVNCKAEHMCRTTQCIVDIIRLEGDSV